MDFRGYLQSINSPALAYTGNDARVDPTKATYQIGNNSAGVQALNYQGGQRGVGYAQQYVNSLYNQFQNSQNNNPATIPSGFGGGASYATPPPNWDLTSIYNQAGSQAAGQVNPYYTKQLQDFQTNQAQAKALQDQQRQLNLTNLQQNLTNTLQGNETSRGRTSQDVLTNEQQIGQQADIRQQDQGAQFDQARIAQAKDQAVGGLTGSGLGNQQTLATQTTRNTQEARQGAQDIQDVAKQELAKARTFEDLANSDVLAKQTKAQGEKQTQIDWDKFVQGQTSSLQTEQNTLETERLARLSEVQKQLANQQVNDMISKLSNPQQRLAAANAYGKSF